MIRDAYDRPVTRVRISLTPACNASCFYCHREGYQNPGPLMRPEEIERIVSVMKRFGVSRVKLTGGEPTLRRDLTEIVSRLAGLGLDDLSMVTNGLLLEGLSRGLREAGLDRINVSLPSLRPERFRAITGVSGLEKVLAGIREASEVGFRQLKVNRVILRGVNDDETDELIDFAGAVGPVVQLIQLEAPSPNDELVLKYGLSFEEMRSLLGPDAELISVREDMHMRPIYRVRGVLVEIVGPMGNADFCFHCTRIRITYDGKFKPCLFTNEGVVDFLTPMRRGASDEELARIFLEAVSMRRPYFGLVV